jgi:hypothetical protein
VWHGICRTPDDDACCLSHVQCAVSGGLIIFVTSILASMPEGCSPHLWLDVCECVRDVRYENKGHHMAGGHQRMSMYL